MNFLKVMFPAWGWWWWGVLLELRCQSPLQHWRGVSRRTHSGLQTGQKRELGEILGKYHRRKPALGPKPR